MAFLLSIALIVVGLVIRLRVAESPVFSRVKERGVESKAPLLEVLRDHRLALVLAIGVVLVSISGFYLVTTFSLSYLTEQLRVSRSVALAGNVLFSVSEAVSILIFARLADRVVKHRVAICGAVCLVLSWVPDGRNARRRAGSDHRHVPYSLVGRCYVVRCHVPGRQFLDHSHRCLRRLA